MASKVNLRLFLCCAYRARSRAQLLLFRARVESRSFSAFQNPFAVSGVVREECVLTGRTFPAGRLLCVKGWDKFGLAFA